MKAAIVAAAAMVFLGGCFATEFFGAPRVKNGPDGCRKACDAWQMELVGMVKMGEYSDGCICQVRGEGTSSGGTGSPRSDASAPRQGALAGQPAIAGVHMQMQAAAAAAVEAQAASIHRASPTLGYRPGNPLGQDR